MKVWESSNRRRRPQRVGLWRPTRFDGRTSIVLGETETPLRGPSKKALYSCQLLSHVRTWVLPPRLRLWGWSRYLNSYTHTHTHTHTHTESFQSHTYMYTLCWSASLLSVYKVWWFYQGNENTDAFLKDFMLFCLLQLFYNQLTSIYEQKKLYIHSH